MRLSAEPLDSSQYISLKTILAYWQLVTLVPPASAARRLIRLIRLKGMASAATSRIHSFTPLMIHAHVNNTYSISFTDEGKRDPAAGGNTIHYVQTNILTDAYLPLTRKQSPALPRLI